MSKQPMEQSVFSGAALSGLALALSLGSTVTAQAAPAHHLTYTFTLAPGASKSFPMPIRNAPVRLSAAATAPDGEVLEPSGVIAAVINQEGTPLQFTWIGTNGDGSPSAGSTPGSGTIAKFSEGAAILTAEPSGSAKLGTLRIMESPQVPLSLSYYVVIDY